MQYRQQFNMQMLVGLRVLRKHAMQCNAMQCNARIHHSNPGTAVTCLQLALRQTYGRLLTIESNAVLEQVGQCLYVSALQACKILADKATPGKAAAGCRLYPVLRAYEDSVQQVSLQTFVCICACS